MKLTKYYCKSKKMPSDTIILLTLTPLFSMSLMHPWGVQGRNPELRSPVNVVGDGDRNDDDVDDDDDDDIDDVCDEDDDDIDDDDSDGDKWYAIGTEGGKRISN